MLIQHFCFFSETDWENKLPPPQIYSKTYCSEDMKWKKTFKRFTVGYRPVSVFQDFRLVWALTHIFYLY